MPPKRNRKTAADFDAAAARPNGLRALWNPFGWLPGTLYALGKVTPGWLFRPTPRKRPFSVRPLKMGNKGSPYPSGVGSCRHPSVRNCRKREKGFRCFLLCAATFNAATRSGVFPFLHSGFLSRLWGCLSSAHLPYKAWEKTGARKGADHAKKEVSRGKPPNRNLPPDSYGVNLSSPRAFPIPGGVKKMMRAADRLPCCALCALRIIFKPPFRFMPRVRCVGVRADQKPGRARSEAEDQRGRVSARTEQRRLFRRFWPVKSGKTAAPEKAQAPPRPAPAGKPGRVKGPTT